jgi:hypothetical protein
LLVAIAKIRMNNLLLLLKPFASMILAIASYYRPLTRAGNSKSEITYCNSDNYDVLELHINKIKQNMQFRRIYVLQLIDISIIHLEGIKHYILREKPEIC